MYLDVIKITIALAFGSGNGKEILTAMRVMVVFYRVKGISHTCYDPKVLAPRGHSRL